MALQRGGLKLHILPRWRVGLLFLLLCLPKRSVSCPRRRLVRLARHLLDLYVRFAAKRRHAATLFILISLLFRRRLEKLAFRCWRIPLSGCVLAYQSSCPHLLTTLAASLLLLFLRSLPRRIGATAGYVLLLSSKTKQWAADFKLNSAATAVTFSPDSRYVLASSADADVYKFDVRSRRCVLRFFNEVILWIAAGNGR